MTTKLGWAFALYGGGAGVGGGGGEGGAEGGGLGGGGVHLHTNLRLIVQSSRIIRTPLVELLTA